MLLAAASDATLVTWAAAVPTFVPALIHPAFQVRCACQPRSEQSLRAPLICQFCSCGLALNCRPSMLPWPGMAFIWQHVTQDAARSGSL